MKNYKYELQKGSKHILCPNCRRKTFKPYVEVGTNNIANAERYGRCERINSCGLLMYPPSEESDYVQWVQPEPKPFERIEPDFIPRGTVENTFKNFEQNVFMQYLRKMFGATKALELQSMYNIGTAKQNGTIFWQQDLQGNFRTGKVMYYGSNGKRLKDRNSWYLHNRVKPNFQLEQVFFGEHLVDKDKPIAMAESEKTAVMMSVYMPEYTWIAAGGSQMLNAFRLSRLPRLDLVCADNGQFEEWKERTKHFDRKMDVTVDKAVSEGLIEEGADILDLWLVKELVQ